MSSVQEIEEAIARLPKEKLAALREWFDACDAEQWDRQSEEDAWSGKLDTSGGKAREHLRAGKCRKL